MSATHELRITRYNRGRSMIAGPSGSHYGTRGRCTCGAWETRENTAPSRGGEKIVRERFAQHLIQEQLDTQPDT